MSNLLQQFEAAQITRKLPELEKRLKELEAQIRLLMAEKV